MFPGHIDQMYKAYKTYGDKLVTQVKWVKYGNLNYFFKIIFKNDMK